MIQDCCDFLWDLIYIPSICIPFFLSFLPQLFPFLFSSPPIRVCDALRIHSRSLVLDSRPLSEPLSFSRLRSSHRKILSLSLSPLPFSQASGLHQCSLSLTLPLSPLSPLKGKTLNLFLSLLPICMHYSKNLFFLE